MQKFHAANNFKCILATPDSTRNTHNTAVNLSEVANSLYRASLYSYCAISTMRMDAYATLTDDTDYTAAI